MRVLSIDHCRTNCSRLVAATGVERTGSPLQQYRRAVAQLRRFPAPDDGIRVSFGDSDIATFCVAQGVYPELADSSPPEQDQAALTQLYEDACEVIRGASPELMELVNLITTDVVFVQSTRIGGGSGSHLPGLIGVSPGSAWDGLEMAKCLVHEATHLSTFLCDMLFGLYVEPASALERDECRVLSAVRVGEKRPLDKALHSALVAVPTMHLEQLVGQSEIQDQFLPSLRDCTAGLKERTAYFTPYGQAVVDDLAAFVETLDYQSVDTSLRMSDDDCLEVVAAGVG